MSKTFKNATNEGTELYVGEGINADSVQLVIRNVGEGIGKAGIYLNSSDIPALALAILEAAGYTEDDTEVSPRKNLVATDYSLGMRYLRFGIEDQEHKAQAKKTAEAEAQAEVQANSKPKPNLEFVTSVEELDALPLGVTVLGADMIAYQMLGDASFPDGRFRETSWWACGNEYEVTSIPLPARVLYRPTEETPNGRE